MNLFDRFQAAYYSPLGTLLLFLLFLLFVELLLYSFLWWKRHKQDLLAARYMQHFDKAHELLKGLKQLGTAQADLWGRVTTVQMSSTSYGRCLVILPELVDQEVMTRFAAFAAFWKEQLVAPFTQLLRYSIEPVWSIVQGGPIRSNGRPLLTLPKHLIDQRLSIADKERLLLQIANALSKLHGSLLANGERAYHGALLPRAICLDLDASSVLKECWITDSGLVYALGPQRFYQLLQQLRRQVLPMERYIMQDWLHWIAMLAPEQQDLQRLNQVGPSVDFYSFGAIAVWLFTEKMPAALFLEDWNLIPQSWHPFLKACLQDNPARRPKDFQELEDWQSDPELSLLAQQPALAVEELEKGHTIDQYSIEKLTSLLRESKSVTEEKNFRREVCNWLEKAVQAQSKGEWRHSIQLYQKALKRLPNHPEICIRLAIAYYEIGEWQKAEEYYELAKQKDPQVAQAFREHVAFHL